MMKMMIIIIEFTCAWMMKLYSSTGRQKEKSEVYLIALGLKKVNRNKVSEGKSVSKKEKAGSLFVP
jgi:hypothetical protein